MMTRFKLPIIFSLGLIMMTCAFTACKATRSNINPTNINSSNASATNTILDNSVAIDRANFSKQEEELASLSQLLQIDLPLNSYRFVNLGYFANSDSLEILRINGKSSEIAPYLSQKLRAKGWQLRSIWQYKEQWQGVYENLQKIVVCKIVRDREKDTSLILEIWLADKIHANLPAMTDKTKNTTQHNGNIKQNYTPSYIEIERMDGSDHKVKSVPTQKTSLPKSNRQKPQKEHRKKNNFSGLEEREI